MLQHMSTANLITLSRIPLLFLVVALVFAPYAWCRLLALFLFPVLMAMDWLDGYMARKKNQVTDLGSVLDIAVDRVVENALWVVFVSLGAVAIWVPLVYITRSFLVDGMRGFALSKGFSAFGMMHSKVGSFLVAGRFMRGLYGLAKGLAFGALILAQALHAMGDRIVAETGWVFAAADGLVYFAVLLCIVRGLPVLNDVMDLLETNKAKEGPKAAP